MQKNDLKKELISFIEKTNDEELLYLLKEDFVFYGKVENIDVTEGLNNNQLKELKALSEEDEMKDTITIDEYKNATAQWRTK